MSQNSLNTELTEEEITQIKKEMSFNDSARKKDTIILIALLLIGILGLAFVLLNGNNPTFAKNNNTHITKSNSRTFHNDAKTFDITGAFIVSMPIIINLKNYKEEDIYMIDFGDNTQKPYNSSLITHQYKQKGRYKLTILNTKTYEIESKYLFIHEDVHEANLAGE